MKTVSVSFYGLKAKKDDLRFRDLMARANQWTPSQLDEFLSKYDMGTIREKTVEEAINLIQAFRDVGVIGAIGGLDNPSYYTKQFQKFYENDGKFKITWNWAAAIFNWLWLFFRGLWAKWLLYGLILSVVSWLLFFIGAMFGNLTINFLWNIVESLGLLCFVGMVGNYDYFLKKTQNENLWLRFPFQKYKRLYWIVILVSFILILGWYGIQVKNMFAFQKQLMNPKISEGKPSELSGVEYAPPVGWQILPSFPISFEMKKYQTRSAMFMIGVEKQGQPTAAQKLFGQLILQISKPKSGVFSSFDQKEIDEILKSHTKGFDQIPFKLMGVGAQSSKPSFLQIGDQQWGKIVSSSQFRGAPSEAAFLFLNYYTIINGQLVVLTYQGQKESQGIAEKTIEDFAATFKPATEAAK